MKVIQHRIRKLLYGILLMGFTTTGVQAQKVNPLIPDYTSAPQKAWEMKFEAFKFMQLQADGHTLPYRFYQPPSGKTNKKFPLVIFLHGAGERGFDNRTQFQRFAPDLFWEKYPCFVLAPQCPSKTAETTNAESVWVDTPFGAASHQMNVNPTWPLKLVMQLIDQTIRNYPVDKDRIYITGLSMGGYATWEILQREGKRFAAAIPVCGGGDPAYAATMKPVKLWAFHGSDDRIVPVKRSRDMVEAVQAAGGNVKYTEYSGVDHDAWSRTYSNPEVWDWLFSQSKEMNFPTLAQSKHSSTSVYKSYKGLVMAGYQGWFNAPDDGAGRGWYHYNKSGKFEPGMSTIDIWPDVTDYTKTYKTAFKYADGTDAFVYSPYDYESVDLHFKWMKEYGLDGVFMQRFVSEIKREKGKRHFNKVLENALKAARKYQRAICVMYDLSGCSSADMQILINDWNELQATFSLFDNLKNPTYLHHNEKPLLVIWGVGFNDNRKYSIADVQSLVTNLKGPEKKVSIMLGVPYYWRTLKKDTENNPALHTVIKAADIIMPWAVGRYNSESYSNTASATLAGDMNWCKNNGVDYVPLAFPGFSWGNLKNDSGLYNQIPRNKGDFFWQQVAGAKMSGAQSLYIAMFDEIDEGTAIYKCLKEGNLPMNGTGKFIGIEQNLETDYYLWLAGKATEWFHGNNDFGLVKPIRQIHKQK